MYLQTSIDSGQPAQADLSWNLFAVRYFIYLFIYLFIFLKNRSILSYRCFYEHFFRGDVLGQDTSELQPSTGETQERHE